MQDWTFSVSLSVSRALNAPVSFPLFSIPGIIGYNNNLTLPGSNHSLLIQPRSTLLTCATEHSGPTQAPTTVCLSFSPDAHSHCLLQPDEPLSAARERRRKFSESVKCHGDRRAPGIKRLRAGYLMCLLHNPELLSRNFSPWF